MSIDKSIKEKAILLRREGKSYSEILKEIPIAKSTLSLWLGSVKLTQKQEYKLSEKKRLSARKGGEARRKQRITRTKEIHAEALKDITSISPRELWLLGIALYWAEGSKEKDYRPGATLHFGNSDARMIRVFLRWLGECCGVSRDKIGIQIYIHENSKNNTESVKKYWSDVTGFPIEKLNKVYYKKNKIKTNRKNVGTLYYGGIRVTVRASSSLVRKISGWTEAIVTSINCGIV